MRACVLSDSLKDTLPPISLIKSSKEYGSHRHDLTCRGADTAISAITLRIARAEVMGRLGFRPAIGEFISMSENGQIRSMDGR